MVSVIQTVTDSRDAGYTVRLTPPTDITAITNDGVGFALRADGTVWAWGYNLDGELGIGTRLPASGVVQVSGLTNVTAIAAGGDHGYALEANGSVWRWGDDVFGTGNGTAFGQYGLVPEKVPGMPHAVGIGASGQDGYAIADDGHVWAWGYGGNGELGNGQTTANSDMPVRIENLDNVVAVADATLFTTYALTAQGQVWAWGQGGFGELGNGTRDLVVDEPVRVVGISDAIAISSTYALSSRGTVYAWAVTNRPPRLDGTEVDPPVDTPVQVSGIQGAIAIAGNRYNGWALTG